MPDPQDIGRQRQRTAPPPAEAVERLVWACIRTSKIEVPNVVDGDLYAARAALVDAMQPTETEVVKP